MAVLNSFRQVEIPLFLDFLAVAVVLIVQPYLFVNRFSKEYGLNRTSEASIYCDNTSEYEEELQERVESDASRWIYYASAAAFVPAVPLALLLGRWSDGHGRRPILLVGLFGTFVSYVAVLLYFELDLPLYTIVLSALVTGITGGRLVTLAAIMSYIVDDCMDKQQRTIRLNVAEGLLSLAIIIGGGGGGVIARHYGLRPLIITMVAAQLASFLYVLIFLKESVHRPSNNNSSEDSKSLMVLLRETAQFFLAKSHYRQQLWCLMLSFTVLMIVYIGAFNLDLLYFRLQPFCVDAAEYGYILIFKFGNRCLFSFLFVPLLIKYAHLSDHTLVQLGLGAFFISKIFLAISVKKYMLYIGLAIGMPVISSPGIFRAMMSKLVDPSEQGTLFSLVAALESLAAFLGSLIFNNSFSYFVKQDLPLLKQSAGYTYLVMAGVLVPASVLLGYGFYLLRSFEREGYILFRDSINADKSPELLKNKENSSC